MPHRLPGGLQVAPEQHATPGTQGLPNSMHVPVSNGLPSGTLAWSSGASGNGATSFAASGVDAASPAASGGGSEGPSSDVARPAQLIETGQRTDMATTIPEALKIARMFAW